MLSKLLSIKLEKLSLPTSLANEAVDRRLQYSPTIRLVSDIDLEFLKSVDSSAGALFEDLGAYLAAVLVGVSFGFLAFVIIAEAKFCTSIRVMKLAICINTVVGRKPGEELTPGALVWNSDELPVLFEEEESWRVNSFIALSCNGLGSELFDKSVLGLES